MVTLFELAVDKWKTANVAGRGKLDRKKSRLLCSRNESTSGRTAPQHGTVSRGAPSRSFVQKCIFESEQNSPACNMRHLSLNYTYLVFRDFIKLGIVFTVHFVQLHSLARGAFICLNIFLSLYT